MAPREAIKGYLWVRKEGGATPQMMVSHKCFYGLGPLNCHFSNFHAAVIEWCYLLGLIKTTLVGGGLQKKDDKQLNGCWENANSPLDSNDESN